MSRVKIGEICHAHRHGLFWAQNMSRVSGCVTGIFFGFCHGLLKRCHVEKKNTDGGVIIFTLFTPFIPGQLGHLLGYPQILIYTIYTRTLVEILCKIF